MANRIVDNVIIVDSAMSNLNVVGGATNNITTYVVQGFSFLAANTTGNCRFTGNDTTDLLWSSAYLNFGSVFLVPENHISFPLGLKLSSIKIPTLTAGTAWVYLA